MSDSKSVRADIARHFDDAAAAMQQAAESCADDAAEAARFIAGSLEGGGKLMLCGNGGSAADCQHIATEFVGTLDGRANPRRGLAALALTCDTSFLTAYSNDFGYDGIFARQVETLGRKGDVLMGISTSGNSVNVVAALEAARGQSITAIALTGRDGGKCKSVADIAICAPSVSTAHIQQIHIAIGHAITARVESLLGVAK